MTTTGATLREVRTPEGKLIMKVEPGATGKVEVVIRRSKYVIDLKTCKATAVTTAN